MATQDKELRDLPKKETDKDARQDGVKPETRVQYTVPAQML